MLPQPGDTLGTLVLRRKLADGGMGSVWVAAPEVGGGEVAVKFLAKNPLEDAESRERFSLEARVASRLRSPHVPELFDYGVRDDGTPYLVMQLLQGVDLGTWLAQRRTLTVSEVARIVEHVGHALAAAHELGVVHRDVKPTNIILTPGDDDFHAYLIDFGIAKSTRLSQPVKVSHPGTTIGTPNYMSPEQLMSDGDLDARADIWSLGVVVYLCLTGQLPFAAENFRELCLAIYCGDFAPVSSVCPGLPVGLDAWFERVLVGDRRRRFPSVAAMSSAFKVATLDDGAARPRAVRSRQASAASRCATLPSIRPVGPLPRPARPSTRTALACVAGGALIAAAVSVAWIAQASPSQNSTGQAGAGTSHPPRPDSGFGVPSR